MAKPELKTNLPKFWKEACACLGFIILLFLLYSTMVMKGYNYPAQDTLETIGKTHKIAEFYKQTGEVPLWNPYAFGGIPNIFSLPLSKISVDFYINVLCNKFSVPFVFFLMAAIGMFFLLLHLKFNHIIAFFSTAMFILAPYYQSLLIVGHITKFEAIMYIPWMAFTFLLFIDKGKIIYVILFALVMGLQLRTQHYQICFYSGLLIFSIGVYPLVQELIHKKYFSFMKKCVLLILACGFSMLLASETLLLAGKYSKYSMRGQNAIDLKKSKTETTAEGMKKGVDVRYITPWSMPARELITLLIPRAFGGVAQEKYTGKEFPQVTNQKVPGYWGNSPISESYYYLGITILLLVLIGAAYNFKNGFFVSLSIYGLVLILWAMGTFFNGFYMFFYNWVPYFNNFRTPSTGLSVVYFICPILAAFGLKALSEITTEKQFKLDKKIVIPILSLLVLGLFINIIGQSFEYLKSGEVTNANTPILKQIRESFFYDDLKRFFIFLILVSMLIFVYLSGYLKKDIVIILISILACTDLLLIHESYNDKPVNLERALTDIFPKTQTIELLEADSEAFRVLPINAAESNRLSYYVESLGSDDLLMSATYYELRNNNLFLNGFINWNVAKTLNVKYVISQSKLEHPNLKPILSDSNNNAFLYQIRDYAKRGFFVKNYKAIADDYDRLNYFNNPDFNATETALLERNPETEILSPSNSSCSLTNHTPNQMRFSVYTDKPSLFVISEVYVPQCKEVFIDNVLVKTVYKANHLESAIIVPKGAHEILVKASNKVYKMGYQISSTSFGFIYLLLLIFGIKNFVIKKKASGINT
ncbi:MAG: hypothetical protein NTX03_13020 [Bacteroidetes bacterium]|nr:hypothetical protein [Bacteroidota bacterium]